MSTKNTFWTTNKKLIISLALGLFIIWVGAVAYVYYWVPKLYELAALERIEIVGAGDEVFDDRKSEDVCEERINKLHNDGSCTLRSSKRILTFESPECQGKQSVAGCFVCRYTCDE